MSAGERLGERFLTRAWDSELVVFDRKTGDTHVLSEVAAAVFLQSVGAGSGAVEGSLVELGVEPSVLGDTRLQLEQLGLV
jgi:hypothetical protein